MLSPHQLTLSPHLFEVGELYQLQRRLSILQINCLVHPGLGVGCGEADQGLQGTGRDGGGLVGTERCLCKADPHRSIPPRLKTTPKGREEAVPQFPVSRCERELLPGLTLAMSEFIWLWLRRREYSSAM